MTKKLLTIIATIICSTLASANIANAHRSYEHNMGNSPKCEVTPTMKHANNKNELARPTNNLYQKTGHADHARGELILVTGIIYDVDCVPVSNAMVQIWQADSNGNYLSSYKFDNAWNDVSSEYDPNFGYSGAVQTSNLGEFSFVTIKPTSKKWGIVPSIDIRVKHEFHETIETRIFFDDIGNNKDRYFKKLKYSAAKLLVAKLNKESKSNIKQYYIPITYNGIDQYRKY